MFNFKLSKTMKDVQWSFISIATASLSHLLLRILLGRELGPDGLGVYTLVFTIYIFGMHFAALGVGGALTRYVAHFSDDIQKTKDYISIGLIVSAFVGFLIGLVLYFTASYIAVNIFDIPAMKNLLKITAFCFPFIAIHKTVIGTLNGFRNMKVFALLNISLNALVLLLSIFIVIVLHMDVTGAVLGFVISTIIVGFISPFFINSYIIIPNQFLLKSKILRNILHFGIYSVLGKSIGYLYIHIDSLMIGYYLNETDVGYYSVAIIFIQAITLIPSAVTRVTTPIIAKSHAKKEFNSILMLVKNVVSRTFLLSLAISLLLVIFGKQLILILFESAFLPSYKPLLILLIGYTIYSMFMSIGTFYSSIGHVHLSYKLAFLSAIIGIILNIIFIPQYGIMGAALATSTTLIIMTAVHLIIIRHFLINFGANN